MAIRLVQNFDLIRQQFDNKFVMNREEFERFHHEWLANCAVEGIDHYEKAFLWDRSIPEFTESSFREALDFLRDRDGTVLFTSEDASHHSQRTLNLNGEKHSGFLAECDAATLAALIEKEWFEDYELELQGCYNPNPILPQDLYVFDDAMQWCVIFTHETTDLETEDLMKAAESRFCLIYTV